jgi:hypothetical protein
MIYLGGFMKGKALIFGILGLVFVVLAFTMSSFTQTTFLIIGIAWIAAAAMSWWMARATEPKQQDPNQPPGPGNWVG